MQKYLLIIVCFCIAISSCKKEREDKTVFTRKDFPATAGSYWTYVYPVILQQTEYTDTLIHKIERVESLSADTQIIYYVMYRKGKFMDSAIGILCNTGFTYIGTPYKGSSVFGDFHLEFPLYPDKSWVSTDSIDTLKVLYYAADYTLPPDNYRDVFYLYNKYQKQAVRISENEILLSRGVGVVMKNKNRQRIDGPGEGVIKLRLIDYHIR